MIRARVAEAQLALMLLTRLPAGRLPEPAPAIGTAAWAFPLAGLAVGLVAAAVLGVATALGLPPMLAAGLALTAQVVVTGGLHEDGLADVADGFWGGRERTRRLEIMRDSRIGSYGTLALILSLGLRWQALAALTAAGHGVAALIVTAGAARVAPVVLMAALPPARADGMGHLARGVPGEAVGTALLIGLAILALVPGTALALLAAALATLGVGLLARAKIDGQSGDVLGTGEQIAEIALLLALVAQLG